VSEVRVIDALGTHCPVPVRLLARAMARDAAVAEFHVLADDPMAEVDIPAWCHTHAHRLVTLTRADGVLTAVVRRGS
jgi:cysteine desulfurase